MCSIKVFYFVVNVTLRAMALKCGVCRPEERENLLCLILAVEVSGFTVNTTRSCLLVVVQLVSSDFAS